MAIQRCYHSTSFSGHFLGSFPNVLVSSWNVKPQRIFPAPTDRHHPAIDNSFLGQPPLPQPKPLFNQTPYDGSQQVSTSIIQKKPTSPESCPLAMLYWIEAKSFTLSQKTTVHDNALQISEHRPSLSRTILVPLSALGWLKKKKKTLRFYLSPKNCGSTVVAERYYQTSSPHLFQWSGPLPKYYRVPSRSGLLHYLRPARPTCIRLVTVSEIPSTTIAAKTQYQWLRP